MISPSASAAIPSPMASNQMTLATPMKTPIAVKKDLMGWVTILSKAALPKFLQTLFAFFPNPSPLPMASRADAPVLAEGSQRGRRLLFSIFPSFITMTRLASAATSVSWVTMTIVFPLEFNSSKRFKTSWVVLLSRLPVGSSAKMKSGSLERERAIPTRCC